MWADLGFFSTATGMGATGKGTAASLPHPRRHRPGRVHGHGQRQPVHERDGAVQPALRGQGARAARRLAPPTRTTRSLRRGQPDRGRGRASGSRPPSGCTCRTTTSSASTRRTRSSPVSRGTSRTRHPTSIPLLLNFHPLVIYRYQVLKQADVVLAMLLRNDQFSIEQKRRNFDYYDPITTGDSSLSACVQAVAAADRIRRSPRSFREALSSIWPTLMGTPPTARTSPRQAGFGGRSSSGSPGCSSPARR